MRTTGVYTSYRGEERRVHGRIDLGVVRLRDADDPTRLAERVASDEVGDVVQVDVTAAWRQGEIMLTEVRGDEVVFVTQDLELARREALHGDQYSGWGGVARIDELGDVREDVTVLQKGPAT